MAYNMNTLMGKGEISNANMNEMTALMGRSLRVAPVPVRQKIIDPDIEAEYLRLKSRIYRNSIPPEEDVAEAYKTHREAHNAMRKFLTRATRSLNNAKVKRRLEEELKAAQIHNEALQIYAGDEYEARKNALRRSIANTENLRRRGLGPVVYNTAVGGKHRRKNTIRRKH